MTQEPMAAEAALEAGHARLRRCGSAHRAQSFAGRSPLGDLHNDFDVSFNVAPAPRAAQAARGSAPAPQWINSSQGQLVFGLAIAVNALVIGLEVEVDLAFGSDSILSVILYVIQCGFVLVFVVELILQILADGLTGFLWSSVRTLRGLEDKFRWENLFDIFVVLVAVVDLWVIAPLTMIAATESDDAGSLDAMSAFRILQLLRLVRIVRILKVSKDLTNLVAGFTKSLRSVCWVFILLVIVIYIGALVCASSLGTSENEELRGYFDSLWVSMYTHFKLMTLESWPDICNLAVDHASVFWFAYFVVYIIITNMALLNLVIGLIMDGVVQNAKSGDEEHDVLEAVEAMPFRRALQEAVDRTRIGITEYCSDCRVDHQYVYGEALSKLLRDNVLQKVLSIYDIALPVAREKATLLLDTEGAGRLTVEELSASLLRLRGSCEVLHPLLVQSDLCSQRASFADEVDGCTKHLCEGFGEDIERFETAVERRLARIGEISERLSAAGELSSPPVSPTSIREAESHQGKYVMALLHQASARARRANAALEEAEEALRRSLAREEQLRQEVEFFENSRWTQTGGGVISCSGAAVAPRSIGDCQGCTQTTFQEAMAEMDAAEAKLHERPAPLRGRPAPERQWPALARPAFASRRGGLLPTRAMPAYPERHAPLHSGASDR